MDAAKLIREARATAGVSQRELARRAGTSQPAVARYESGASLPTLRTLERLLAACGQRVVLGVAPVGPRVERSPLARRVAQARGDLLRASRRHGARHVRVFGSVARAEDRADSDVDLLVDLEPGRTLLDLLAFRREAAEILGAPVDVATPDMLPDDAAAARAESIGL